MAKTKNGTGEKKNKANHDNISESIEKTMSETSERNVTNVGQDTTESVEESSIASSEQQATASSIQETPAYEELDPSNRMKSSGQNIVGISEKKDTCAEQTEKIRVSVRHFVLRKLKPIIKAFKFLVAVLALFLTKLGNFVLKRSLVFWLWERKEKQSPGTAYARRILYILLPFVIVLAVAGPAFRQDFKKREELIQEGQQNSNNN